VPTAAKETTQLEMAVAHRGIFVVDSYRGHLVFYCSSIISQAFRAAVVAAELLLRGELRA